MTFQQLYYLLEVEKTGSFSIAAKKLFVTQSTISNAVASLEKEVGSPIFIRGKKALTLTPTGVEILSHAKRICESHKYITTGKRSQSPVVSIGSKGFSPARNAFVQLVEENRDRDDIRFVLHDARGKNFEEELLAYRMDVAVAMFTAVSLPRQEENFRKKGLYYEKLITVPGAICIGPGHRLYHQEKVTLQDLKNDPLIELPSKLVSRNVLQLHDSKSIGTTYQDARRDLLLKGLGYTLTHMHSAEERKVSPMRYIEIPELTYTFCVFYDSLRPLRPEVRRFLEILRENVANYIL